MSDVSVDCTKSSDGWVCNVVVSDNKNSSRHKVEVPQSDLNRLYPGDSPEIETLVEASFEFLLDREPKSSILSEFEISTIEQYFPDYSTKIGKYLP